MSRKTEFLQYTGEYFHVYNRGVNCAQIFFSDADYTYFLEQMDMAFDHSSLSLHAFALMPNHFHMILRQNVARAISPYLKRVCERHARRINKLRQRSGHLFQGRFKMKHIDDPNYLLHLSRYIHLNPVQAGLAKVPEDWKCSSCGIYFNGVGDGLVTTQEILTQAGGVEAYRRYLHSESPPYGEEIERYLIDRELL